MSTDSKPETQRQIACLEQRLRKLQVFTIITGLSLVAVLSVAVIGRVYADAPGQAKTARFDTLTVKRINVVENDGTRRMIISGATHAPPVYLNGKTYKRATSNAGIVFYDEKGDERGGIGVATRNGGEQSVLAFDYRKSEALGLIRAERGKNASAGLIIADPAPAGARIGENGNLRIKVQTVNGDAHVVLNDADGKPRLRLTVAKNGEPAIELLDATGKVTRKITSGTPE